MHALSIAEAQEIDTSVVPDIHAYLAGYCVQTGRSLAAKLSSLSRFAIEHLDLHHTPHMTRQIETEGKLIQGIISGSHLRLH